jgi:hypothetical protein
LVFGGTTAIDHSTHPSYFTAMKNKLATAGTLATCHCGAVTISLAARPAEITECNCSLCKSYGVLWAYYYTGEIVVTPNPPPTETYAWNGKNRISSVILMTARSCFSTG